MSRTSLLPFLLIVASILTSSCSSPDDDLPGTLHLTWCDDPTRSMQIQWLYDGAGADTLTPPTVAFRTAGGRGDWREVHGYSEAFPVVEELTHSRYGANPRIARVGLRNLEPNTEYEFRLPGYRRPFLFRTAPLTLDKPIRFAVAGDLHVGDTVRATYRAIAAEDPLFVALGGDIAYDDGIHTAKTVLWLEEWSQSMIARRHRLIPVLAAVGNHEVRGHFVDKNKTYDEMRERAPFFLSVFDCQTRHRSYSVVDIGDFMSLFLLDSNHLSPVDGEQSEWLDYEMAARHTIPHLFPIYHVPAYPSVPSVDTALSALIRGTWVPIFERHSVRIAFEHHAHAYKRTWPLRSGEIDEATGITYVGDGAAGAGLQVPEAAPYLRTFERVHHAIIVDVVDRFRVDVRAISADGEVVDQFSVPR